MQTHQKKWDEDYRFVQRCLRNDETAWNEFFQNYRSVCLIISRKYNLHRDLFDDLFSEFIIKLLGTPEKPGALKKYAGKSSLKSYISVVFIHLIMDFYRASKKQKEKINIDDNFEIENATLDSSENETDEMNLAQTLLSFSNDDINILLSTALQQLNNLDRDIFTLYNYQKLKLKQISEIYNCSEAKISRKLKKIRASLQCILIDLIAEQRL